MKTLRDARRAGYDVTLIYVGLDDVEQCLRRIRLRARLGGHDVPEIDVRRRFGRSIEALPDAIRLADRIVLYENSDERPYRLIARIDSTGQVVSDAVPRWAQSSVIVLMERFS
jgi:predicted ABC-type ATPase